MCYRPPMPRGREPVRNPAQYRGGGLSAAEVAAPGFERGVRSGDHEGARKKSEQPVSNGPRVGVRAGAARVAETAANLEGLLYEVYRRSIGVQQLHRRADQPVEVRGTSTTQDRVASTGRGPRDSQVALPSGAPAACGCLAL